MIVEDGLSDNGAAAGGNRPQGDGPRAWSRRRWGLCESRASGGQECWPRWPR
jgi:hypothetical protein